MPWKDSGVRKKHGCEAQPEPQPEVGSSSPVFYALCKGPAITWRPCWNWDQPRPPLWEPSDWG